jgi:hypothetical protein
VVHHCGDEGAWWNTTGIDPTVAASAPWLETHPLAMAGDKMREAGSIATVGTDQGNGKRNRLLSEPGPNYERRAGPPSAKPPDQTCRQLFGNPVLLQAIVCDHPFAAPRLARRFLTCRICRDGSANARSWQRQYFSR